MSGHQALIAGYDNLIGCDSADFDGTDYMTRGATLTGAADGKVGTVSIWFRIDGGDGTDMTVLHAATTVAGATSRFRVRRTSANVFEVVGINAAAATILTLTSNTTYTAGATWRNILASWNLATAAGHLYVTDTEDLAAGATLTDDSIDYTVADWAIGGQASGGTLFDGCLAEFYFALEYIDLSSTANRRKFISANGRPMVIGATGSFPTGTAAIVYQRVADGAAVATFATNLGTGGDFVITGTLATGSTSPSG